MRRAEVTITGRNSSSTQASLPPARTTAPIMKSSVKICCRKSLSTVDIAFCTRSTSLISVEDSVPVVWLWKKFIDRRSNDSYRSLRRSVIIPNPALFASNVPA